MEAFRFVCDRCQKDSVCCCELFFLSPPRCGWHVRIILALRHRTVRDARHDPCMQAISRHQALRDAMHKAASTCKTCQNNKSYLGRLILTVRSVHAIHIKMTIFRQWLFTRMSWFEGTFIVLHPSFGKFKFGIHVLMAPSPSASVSNHSKPTCGANEMKKERG